MSNARLNPYTAAPKAVNAMLELSRFVENCGLERSLLELVKIRASQINGCAYCIHMHVKDALKYGESEMRLHLLAVDEPRPEGDENRTDELDQQRDADLEPVDGEEVRPLDQREPAGAEDREQQELASPRA